MEQVFRVFYMRRGGVEICGNLSVAKRNDIAGSAVDAWYSVFSALVSDSEKKAFVRIQYKKQMYAVNGQKNLKMIYS